VAGLKQVCTQPDVPFLAQLGIRHRYQIARRLRAAQSAAGCGKRWTTHDLRRTYARQMFAVTKDIRTVQKAMSHRNPVHTLWYLDNPEARLTAEDMSSAEPKGTQ
jgi:site-specific recombinase XerC